MNKPLTHLLIKSRKPSDKREEVPDGKLGGLYLVVQPSGAKSWAVRYRFVGRPKKFTIGPYPAIDLGTARKRAQEALSEVAKGVNPAAQKQAAKAAARAEKRPALDMVEKVVADFIDRYAKRETRDWRETKRLLEKDIVRAFKGRRLSDIGRADVTDLLDRIRIDRDASRTAKNTLAVARKMGNWALERGLVEKNPFAGVVAPVAQKSRERGWSDGPTATPPLGFTSEQNMRYGVDRPLRSAYGRRAMLHDSELMPFEPPKGRAKASVFLTNHLAAIPAAAYEEPFTFLKHFWPFADLALVADPVLIEELLIARADEFPRDRLTSQALSEAIDRGSLLLAEGADWRWQRRAVAPAFRHENLLGFVPTFAACARRRVELWQAQSGGSAVLDVSAAMTQTTFDIILDAVLGGAAALDRDRYLSALDTALNSVPWQAALAVVGLPASFPHPGRARARRAADYGYGEVAKLVAARKAQRSARKDVLNLLIGACDPETGRTMSDAQVIANLYLFIFAGHETAAAVLGWTLWLLAKDQASQERLRAEIAQVAGDAEIGPTEIDRLVFTRCVAQEAMRLFPPAPLIARAAREDTTLGPHRISKKTVIVVPIWLLHRHKRLWDEPHGFEPGRFTPENMKARHRCAYIPFGAGPRTCVGMNFAMLEIVTVLATLVREFKFSPAPGFKLELSSHVTLRSKNGLPLIVESIRAAPAGSAYCATAQMTA